jgi:hypothetical protein
MLLLHTARWFRQGATTHMTLGPLQPGGSVCFDMTRQRHDPHMLSNVLQSLSTMQVLLFAGMAGVPGWDPLGSEPAGADASSSMFIIPISLGALGRAGRIGGVPTFVIASAGREASVAADVAWDFAAASLGVVPSGASCSGSLEPEQAKLASARLAMTAAASSRHGRRDGELCIGAACPHAGPGCNAHAQVCA